MNFDGPVVASRGKRFWAFAIDQTIISIVVLIIFIAVFATQAQQLAHAFNVFFGNPLWSQIEQLPPDIFEARLEALMSSEEVVHSVQALAHPFALALTLSLIFEAIYYIVPTVRSGATLGKKWLRIAVHTLNTSTTPDWWQSSIRYFSFLGLGTFSGIVTILDLVVNKSFLPSNTAVDVLGAILSQIVGIVTIVAVIMIVVRSDRRGLHDVFAHTIVHDIKKG